MDSWPGARTSVRCPECEGVGQDPARPTAFIPACAECEATGRIKVREDGALVGKHSVWERAHVVLERMGRMCAAGEMSAERYARIKERIEAMPEEKADE